MSIIYILVFLFLFLKNGSNNQILDLIKSIDFQSIAPFLDMLGINPQIKEFINSNNLNDMLNGNFDFKKVLPMLMPLISEFIKNKGGFSFENTKTDTNIAEHLSPIKDIASDYITTTFEEIFS